MASRSITDTTGKQISKVMAETIEEAFLVYSGMGTKMDGKIQYCQY